MNSFNIICAYLKSNRGIGYENGLPWDIGLLKDIKRFNYKTTFTLDPNKLNAVIMGKNTFESLPKKYKPLPNRLNIIISKTFTTTKANISYTIDKKTYYMLKSPETRFIECFVFESLNQALNYCYKNINIDKVFVIGGAKLYNEAIIHPDCKKLILTEVNDNNKDYISDCHFPQIPNDFNLTKEKYDPEKTLVFKTYHKSTHEEYQYLNLIKKVLNEGHDKRNNLSIFGHTMRFNLNKGFPLLTTKRVPFKTMKKELMWFIRGSTDNKKLNEENVHIWDANADKKFLKEKRNLSFEKDGDLGPIYGFQWRHFGTNYKGCDHDYTGKGVDQLEDIIETLRDQPNSRRIIMSAWNPKDLHKMALPPCHVLCQFYTSDNGKKLSCQMYQRSADIGLGVPFNIASYALLTCLIAHELDMEPHEFIHVIGDAHIYKSHIEGLKEQLKRTPHHPFPKIEISDNNNNNKVDHIQSILNKKIVLHNYNYHKDPIKLKIVT